MIKEIFKKEIYRIITDEKEYNQYTRYSEGNWTVTIGESDEPVYDCEKLEIEFKKIMKNETNI